MIGKMDNSKNQQSSFLPIPLKRFTPFIIICRFSPKIKVATQVERLKAEDRRLQPKSCVITQNFWQVKAFNLQPSVFSLQSKHLNSYKPKLLLIKFIVTIYFVFKPSFKASISRMISSASEALGLSFRYVRQSFCASSYLPRVLKVFPRWR